MTNNQLGLVVGALFAVVHAVWSIAVAIMPMTVQSFMNWVLTLHHISLPLVILTPFNMVNAIFLVVVTFVCGYLIGFVLNVISTYVLRK